MKATRGYRRPRLLPTPHQCVKKEIIFHVCGSEVAFVKISEVIFSFCQSITLHCGMVCRNAKDSFPTSQQLHVILQCLLWFVIPVLVTFRLKAMDKNKKTKRKRKKKSHDNKNKLSKVCMVDSHFVGHPGDACRKQNPEV